MRSDPGPGRFVPDQGRTRCLLRGRWGQRPAVVRLPTTSGAFTVSLYLPYCVIDSLGSSIVTSAATVVAFFPPRAFWRSLPLIEPSKDLSIFRLWYQVTLLSAMPTSWTVQSGTATGTTWVMVFQPLSESLGSVVLPRWMSRTQKPDSLTPGSVM